MALIHCEECGSELSDKAKTCPNCGFDQSAGKSAINIEGAILRKTVFPVFIYFVICLAGIYFDFFDYSNAFFSHSIVGDLKSWLWGGIIFLFGSVGWNRHPLFGGWLNAWAICTVLWWTVYLIMPEDAGKDQSMKAAENNSGWKTSATTDVMTEVRTYHAISNQTVPLEPLKFPYHDVKTRMGFSCQPSNGFQIYFVFNKANIPRTRYESGGRYIDARVKFDDNIETYPLLIIEAAEDSLYFTSDLSPTLYLENESSRTIFSKLLNSKSALLRLEYSSNGYVDFRYDLNGRVDIAQTVADCGLIPKKS